MKRVFIVFCAFVALVAHGQNYGGIDATMMDKIRKSQQDISLTYDDSWNPIGQFSIQNVFNKVIVGVEIRIWYKGYDTYDIFQPTTTHRTKTLIRPQERKMLTFDLVGTNGSPKSFAITRIRFSDGTICE